MIVIPAAVLRGNEERERGIDAEGVKGNLSIEENKALMRRCFEEALNQGKLALVDEIFAPGFVDHSTPEQVAGPGGVKRYFELIRAGFPDMQVSIDQLIAEGDKVALRTTWRGTHRGEYEGIAPTGKRVTRTMLHIFGVRGGKIQEEWVEGQSLGQLIRPLGTEGVQG